MSPAELSRFLLTESESRSFDPTTSHNFQSWDVDFRFIPENTSGDTKDSISVEHPFVNADGLSEKLYIEGILHLKQNEMQFETQERSKRSKKVSPKDLFIGSVRVCVVT